MKHDIDRLSVTELRRLYPSEYNAYAQARRKARQGTGEVSPQFADFRAFLRYIGRKMRPDHSLDRIKNSDKSYRPGNVRWADKKTQANNRSNTIWLLYEGSVLTEHQGERKPLTEWAELSNQNANTLRRRRHEGWTDTEVIEGKRSERPKTFQQMNEEQLLAYQPWDPDNREEQEQLFRQHRRPGENRFQFQRRFLAGRWQRELTKAAPNGIMFAPNVRDAESDYWFDDDNLTQRKWILHPTGDEKAFNRIVREQKEIDDFKAQCSASEKKWQAALDRKLRQREALAISRDIRRSSIERLTSRPEAKRAAPLMSIEGSDDVDGDYENDDDN